MTKVTAEIFPRVATAGETVEPKVPIVVKGYSWNVRGGPFSAQLEMVGDPLLTWDVLDWLRCPVILRDERGTPVWWGFVESVEVGVGSISVGGDIDSLSNRIAVAYTENTGAGSMRGTTPWEADAGSIAIFGTKELLLSQSDLNAASAIAYRDAQLGIRKTPRSIVNPGYGTKTVARISCRGWYQTIGWKYYARSQGRYAFLPTAGTSTATYGFGLPAVTDPDPSKAKPAVIKIAQMFSPSSGAWGVSTIKLQIRKVGSPTEGVRLSLWTNHAVNGEPQTEIQAETVPDGDIGTAGGDWVTFNVSPVWPADNLNTYWIVVERNGGTPNKDNYYTIQGASVVVTPPGYPKFWNGSAWVTQLNAQGAVIGSIAFIMEGTEETNIQMGEMITASEFIEGYRVSDQNMLTTVGSGVFSNPFRNGDTTALTELTSLLNVGNSDGKRYLSTLMPGRFLWVYPEPEENRYTNWSLTPEGVLLDEFGTVVPPASCPVGKWVSIEGLLPRNTGINVLSIPPAFFIESSTYNAVTGSLDLTPRGVAGLEDIGRIRQG